MFERLVEIYPAFDKRHPDPSKNYGIHGVELIFLLKGPEGAVQFVIYTHWMLPHIYEEEDRNPLRFGLGGIHSLCRPTGANKGYHSLRPLYNGQTTMGPCKYLDGKPCYYDGSGLNAGTLLQKMIAEGGEAMWKDLEEFYAYEFFGREKEAV